MLSNWLSNATRRALHHRLISVNIR